MGAAKDQVLDRRTFLGASLVLVVPLANIEKGVLELTPDCGEDQEPTPDQGAGPFYKSGTPERQSLLEPELKGEKLVVSGRVLAQDGKPIAGVILDFWQANTEGNYDNTGFRLRGHQKTDTKGRYRLETIVPGKYEGRARHIHVRIQPEKGTLVDTHLYFPNEPGNAEDSMFMEALTLKTKKAKKVKTATFDFVVAPPKKEIAI